MKTATARGRLAFGAGSSLNRQSLPSDERKGGASRRNVVVQSLSLAACRKTVGRSLLAGDDLVARGDPLATPGNLGLGGGDDLVAHGD